jgi:hypothetical protein
MPVLLFFDLYWFDFPFIKGIEPGEIQGNGQLYSYLKNEKNVSRIVSQEPLERQNQCIYYDLCNLGGYHGLPLNIYKKTFDKFKQNPLPFYNLMGVNYLISAQEFSHSKFQKVISFPPWNIYRLTFTMPKAWFVWKQRVFENEDTLLNVLNSPEFNPFEEILLVQEPSGINTESFEQGQGRIVLKKYGYNEIILEIQAPASCFLMLNEFFYPEWKAHIDNKSVKIFQADYFLRAIPVKEGSHKVVLYYSKQKAVGGIIISCIFLLAFLTIAVITLKKT